MGNFPAHGSGLRPPAADNAETGRDGLTRSARTGVFNAVHGWSPAKIADSCANPRPRRQI